MSADLLMPARVDNKVCMLEKGRVISPFQKSNFTCTKLNVNKLKQRTLFMHLHWVRYMWSLTLNAGLICFCVLSYVDVKCESCDVWKQFKSICMVKTIGICYNTRKTKFLFAYTAIHQIQIMLLTKSLTNRIKYYFKETNLHLGKTWVFCHCFEFENRFLLLLVVYHQ